MNQTKGQWAAGEVAAVISSWLTIPPQERPDLALVSQPCVWCVLSQHLSGTRKDRACQNQGSVFNVIMTTVETVNIAQNQRERGRLLWTSVKRGDWPYTSCYHPGGYRNTLTSTLGAQLAETWWPNQGSGTPGLAIVWAHPIHMGQVPVPGGPISALYLQCVLSPQSFPTSELRVVPWLTCGPFSSLHLVAFTWGQAPLSGLLFCVLLSENVWRCHINTIADHMLIHTSPLPGFPFTKLR